MAKNYDGCCGNRVQPSMDIIRMWAWMFWVRNAWAWMLWDLRESGFRTSVDVISMRPWTVWERHAIEYGCKQYPGMDLERNQSGVNEIRMWTGMLVGTGIVMWAWILWKQDASAWTQSGCWHGCCENEMQ